MPRGRWLVTAGLSFGQILERAYRKGVLRAKELAREYFSRPSETRPTFAVFRDQNPLFADIVELEGWVYPELGLEKERAERIKRIAELSLPYEVAKLLLDSQRPGKGAPIKPDIRHAAVKALEAKRCDKNFSWMRFARRNCLSRDLVEVLKYRECVRQAAMQLQKLMRRLEISY
jgi:hypothetical protein